jgi:hypothetical protein
MYNILFIPQYVVYKGMVVYSVEREMGGISCGEVCLKRWLFNNHFFAS